MEQQDHFSLQPTTPFPAGIAELPPPDMGALSSAKAAASSAITLSNPGAIAFRAVRNHMADFYASDLFSQAVGYGHGVGEGKIAEEDYKSIFHRLHPAMVGKWDEHMSWARAAYMLEDREREDGYSWRTAPDYHNVAPLVGGLGGGLFDVTTPFTLMGGRPIAQVLARAERLGLSAASRRGIMIQHLAKASGYGVAENAAAELPTAWVQEYALGEDRKRTDTMFAIAAGAIVPPGLELGSIGFERITRKLAVANREELARAAMGERLSPPLEANVRANAQAAAAAAADVPDHQGSFDDHARVMTEYFAKETQREKAKVPEAKVPEAKVPEAKVPEAPLTEDPAITGPSVLDTPRPRFPREYADTDQVFSDVVTRIRDGQVPVQMAREMIKAREHKLDDPSQAFPRASQKSLDSIIGNIRAEIKLLEEAIKNRKVDPEGPIDAMPAQRTTDRGPGDAESILEGESRTEHHARQVVYEKLFGSSKFGPTDKTAYGNQPGLEFSRTEPFQIVRPADNPSVVVGKSDMSVEDALVELGIKKEEIAAIKTEDAFNRLVAARLEAKRKRETQIDRNRKVESEQRMSKRKGAKASAQNLVDSKGGARARREASISSEDLSANLRAPKVNPKTGETRAALTLGSKTIANWIQFWSELVGKSGREVRYFDPKDPVQRALFGEGQIDGATHFTDGNTVYISIATLSDFNRLAGTIGHEIGHTVLYRSFAEWHSIVDTIVNSGDPHIAKLLRDTLDAFGKDRAFQSMSNAKKMDEAIANIFGQAFQSKAFWDKYTEMHGATAFQRLSEFVCRVIRDISNKLRGFDPETEASIDAIYDNLVRAIGAEVDENITSHGELVAARQRIYNEYGGKFMNLVSKPLNAEERLAIENADRVYDEMFTEIPQQAGDTKSYITRFKGTTIYGAATFIPVQDTYKFKTMDPLDIKKQLFSLVMDHPAGKTVRGMLAEAYERRIASIKENPGDPGRPIITYELGRKGSKDGVYIKLAYPDGHSSIKPRLEKDFSHSEALVREWLGDFGWHHKEWVTDPDTKDHYKVLTKAANDLQTLADLVQDLFFHGKESFDEVDDLGRPLDPETNPRPPGRRTLGEDLATFAYSSDRLVQEFLYSKEFKEIFDTDLRTEDPDDVQVKNLVHDSFLEAIAGFRQRKLNEAIADGADIEGSLDSFQDRINEYRETSTRFLSREETLRLAEFERRIGEPASKEATNKDMLSTVLERFLRSLSELREDQHGAAPKTPKGFTGLVLPSSVERDIKKSREAIKAAHELFGTTLRGNLDTLAARLTLDNDYQIHTYHSLIDEPFNDARIPQEIFARYAQEILLSNATRPRADLYLEVMDRWFYDALDEIPVTLARHVDDAIEAEVQRIAQHGTKYDGLEINQLRARYASYLSPSRVYTKDGVTHSHLEHVAIGAMRTAFGEKMTNRWITHFGTEYNKGVKGLVAPSKETLKEYNRRRAADEKASKKGGGGQSVESIVKDMTPGSRALAEEADTSEHLFFGDDLREELLSEDKRVSDANTDENAAAALEDLNEKAGNEDTLDELRTPQELAQQIEDDTKVEMARLAMHRDNPVKTTKKTIDAAMLRPDVVAAVADPAYRGLVAMMEKSARNAKFGKKRTDQFLHDHEKLPIALSDLDAADIHDKVREAGRLAFYDGKSHTEIRAIIEAVSDEVHDADVNDARLNFLAVAGKAAHGTLSAVQNTLDGDLRYSGDNLTEMVFNGKVQAPGQSLDVSMAAARNTVTHGINTAIDAIPGLGHSGAEKAAVLKQALDAHAGKPMPGIAPELHAMFKTLGSVIETSVELGRGLYNEAGGRVKKNKQFLFSIRHNLSSIRKDPIKWSNDMIGSLDWKTVERNAMLPRNSLSTASGRQGFLDGMVGDLEKAERSAESTPFDPVADDFAARDQWHRVLAFKDNSAMIDYDVNWGSGDPLLELVNQLNARAERSVMLKEWGPNYKANFDHVLDLVRKAPTGKVAQKLYSAQESAARIAFDHYAGLLNNPVSQRVATIGQSVRFAANLAFGWMSTPSSLTDLAGVKRILRDMGSRGYPSLFASYIKGMATDSGIYTAHVKTVLQGNLAGTQALLSANTREAVGVGERGFLAYGNRMIFTANGQRRHTTVLQFAMTDVMAHRFGEMASDVRSGKGLDADARRWLVTHKITEAEFAKMAADADEVELRIGEGPKTVLLPTMVRDRGLRQKLMFGLKDSMDYGILQPSGSDQGLLTFGLRAGTVGGEAMRCITQYKSFSMAMNTRNRRRFRAYNLDPSLAEGKYSRSAIYATQLLAMGLLATQIKDVLAGKEPLTFVEEDQRTFENVHRVVMQAGLFTAMQDLGVSKDGLTMAGLGPMPAQALKFAGQLVSDQPNNIERASRTLVNTTPFSTVPFWNNIKHEVVQGFLSDSYGIYSDNLAASVQSKTGQDNFLYKLVGP